MNKLRIRITGVGQIGKNHPETCARKIPDIEIVAASGINRNELKRVARPAPDDR